MHGADPDVPSIKCNTEQVQRLIRINEAFVNEKVCEGSGRSLSLKYSKQKYRDLWGRMEEDVELAGRFMD